MVKTINYTNKYVNDSIKQLHNGNTVYAISDKMKRDLEREIDLLGLDITRETCNGYWAYYKKEETKWKKS